MRANSWRNKWSDRLAAVASSGFFRISLAIIVSAVSMYLALRNVNLDEVGNAFSRADLGYVAVALLTVAINTFGKAIRWRVLAGALGQRTNILKLTGILLIGQMFNLLFPARIGDVSRSMMLGRTGSERSFALGTVIVEKIIDLVCYGAVFVWLLLLMPLPGWASDPAAALIGVAVLVLLLTVLITRERKWLLKVFDRATLRLPEQLRKPVINYAHAGLSSVQVLENRPDSLKLLFWSVLVWGTGILTNYLVLLALRVDLPLAASLLVMVLLQAGLTIPSIPGRIGLFEYLCVLALGVFGVEQAVAFSYGILLHMIVLLPTTIIAATYLGFLELVERQSVLGSSPKN